MLPNDILAFWFDEQTEKNWFVKDEAFDEEIRQRFGECYQRVIQGEMVTWREELKGRLAEIIVLDQFSRNMFRDSGKAFAQDGMALVLAQEALKVSGRELLTAKERSFLYMPFMHSESRVIHQQAFELFSEAGLENNLAFEKRHAEIIERFGRYPHRNQVLNRQSTPAELTFLKEPNSSF